MKKTMPIAVYALIASLLTLSTFSKAETPQPVDQLTGEALHIKLVETAFKYDFYNKRCRGVSVSAEIEQTNRLFLKKYGMTVNNFIKAHIDRNPRSYQNRLKRELYQQIYEMGGCDQSKDKGLVKQFQEEFRTLINRAESSPWFPLES